MLQSDTQHELGKFLKSLENADEVYFTLNGAVITGQFAKTEDVNKIIELYNSTTSTGGSTVETGDAFIPREQVIAWGNLGD